MVRPNAGPAALTDAQHNAQTAFYEALSRMEHVIDQETELLQKNRAVELTDFNLRKRQGLLELNRILRNLNEAEMRSIDHGFVRNLARKLEENRQVLAHDLNAMEEISRLVSRAMQEAESDGTYGRGGGAQR